MATIAAKIQKPVLLMLSLLFGLVFGN